MPPRNDDHLDTDMFIDPSFDYDEEDAFRRNHSFYPEDLEDDWRNDEW